MVTYKQMGDCKIGRVKGGLVKRMGGKGMRVAVASLYPRRLEDGWINFELDEVCRDVKVSVITK
jgi:hypothetical protein